MDKMSNFYRGDRICSNGRKIEVFAFEDFKHELERCMNVEGGNEIWCSMHGTPEDYPSLSVIVDETVAVVNYFGAEDGNDMFSSLGDTSQDGIHEFLDDQYEVEAYQLISKKLALQVVLQFFEKQDRPDCIEWEEL